MNDLNNQLKELEKNNEKLNTIIKQLKNTIGNNINGNITVKDNTLSKLLLLSYLTRKDNSIVLQNLIK